MCMCIVQIEVCAVVRLLSCAAMWSPWPSLLLYRQCAAVTTQWHFFRVRKWGLRCTHLSLTSSLNTRNTTLILCCLGPALLLSCVLKALSWLRCISYSRELSGEKFSRISRLCGYSQNFSPQNVWGVTSFHGTSEQSTQVFSAKILFCGSFLPQKFSTVANMAVYSFFLVWGCNFHYTL